MATTPSSLPNQDAIFRKFDDYPWIRDRPFLQGLVAMLGPLSNSFERQKALGVTLQARIWWYASRQSITIDRAAYESWSSSSSNSGGVSVDAALLEKISEIQTRMGISSSSPASEAGNGDGGSGSLPAWMVSAPQKVDLAKKADDGAGAEHGGSNSGGEAPYPAHFQAIIEAVTTGQPVAGVREIPNTVVRQAGILPVGKMQPPRKPWERQQSQQAVAGGNPSTSLEGADVGSLGGQLDKEFPPVGEPGQTVDNRM